MAVGEALRGARFFVLGCDKLVVATDHLPLVPFLNTKGLSELSNPRLIALKEKTL